MRIIYRIKLGLWNKQGLHNDYVVEHVYKFITNRQVIKNNHGITNFSKHYYLDNKLHRIGGAGYIIYENDVSYHYFYIGGVCYIEGNYWRELNAINLQGA